MVLKNKKQTVSKKKNVFKKKKTTLKVKAKQTIKKVKTKKIVKKIKTKPKKTTQKVMPKKKKSVSKKKTKSLSKQEQETLTLGLMQEEIDEILSSQESKEQKEIELQNAISLALTQLFPDNEQTVEQESANSTQFVIENKNSQNELSPFVLDLSALVSQKKTAIKKKQAIKKLVNQVKQDISQIKKIEQKFDNTQQTGLPVIKNSTKTKQKLKFTFTIPKFNKKTDLNTQHTTKPWHYHTHLPLYWHKTIAVYMAICLLIILPIKVFGFYDEVQKSQAQIVNYANSAFEDIKIAGQNLSEQSTAQATSRFVEANHSLTEANQELDNIDTVLKTILKIIPTGRGNLSDAEYLIDSGKQITNIGKNLSGILTIFNNENTKPTTEKIAELQQQMNSIIPAIDNLNNNLHKLNIKAVPTKKQAQFTAIKKYTDTLSQDLKELNSFTKVLNQILGSQYKRRYLFVFQNNNEIRPTGGFIGSFALVDIDRGKITNIQIPKGGTYDMQGSLLTKTVSPYPLHLINPLWEMQDANWFADFQTSAQKIQWFYENSGGPSTDGVIAINASLIPEILEFTGPIYLEKYNLTFSSENFIQLLQENIDQNKTSKTPKAILSDLAPKLLENLFNSQSNDILSVAKVFKNGLNDKDIQMYFVNESIQNKISSYGWTGQMPDTSKDFLAVINANIGGGKTDNFIDQTIELVSDIGDNGEIINNLTITREYKADTRNKFSQTSNLEYMKIYTPVGSQLISATGFQEVPAEAFELPDKNWQTDEFLTQIQEQTFVEPQTNTFISKEFNKTVFGNWVQTDPNEKTQIIVRYKLPFRFNYKDENQKRLFQSKTNAFHSLYIQKQAGAQNTTYSAIINLPKNTISNWLYPDTAKLHGNQLLFESDSKQDELIALTAQ